MMIFDLNGYKNPKVTRSANRVGRVKVPIDCILGPTVCRQSDASHN